jgi:hypothetical protein
MYEDEKAGSLQERLVQWANATLEEAAKLPPGPERDALLAKVQQAEAASTWLDSGRTAPQTSFPQTSRPTFDD